MAFERGRSKAEVIISTSPKPIAPNPRPVNTGVTIGHVHLKVTDLNRAIAFYCGVLPCELLRGQVRMNAVAGPRSARNWTVQPGSGQRHVGRYWAIRYLLWCLERHSLSTHTTSVIKMLRA